MEKSEQPTVPLILEIFFFAMVVFQNNLPNKKVCSET